MSEAATPAALGYRMPAEWEPHAATWLAWPHARGDWPGKFETVPWVFAEIVRHLIAGERVRILVDDARMQRRAADVLRRAGVRRTRIDFFRVPTDRSWMRDSCPQFVRRVDGDVALVGWRFNGWAKYRNHRRDARVSEALARMLGRQRWAPSLPNGHRPRPVVLEGGALDVNGRGTVLVTEECLLSRVQARNPGVRREAMERLLGAFLGVRKVLWLGRGIAGDDTHGHVDDVARFVDARTVVIAEEPDPADPNHEPLRENRARLAHMTDQDGRRLRVVPLPMPSPVVFAGQRLPASYANFYVANAAVLVPTFNDARDREALAVLAALFPSRPVIGIHAVDLVLGLGTLHCLTQQEPA